MFLRINFDLLRHWNTKYAYVHRFLHCSNPASLLLAYLTLLSESVLFDMYFMQYL